MSAELDHERQHELRCFAVKDATIGARTLATSSAVRGRIPARGC